MKFEDLLRDYALDNIDISQFLMNALITALLAWIVSLFYKKFGRSVSNRSQFSHNFILLALTTMLIITIVKSSIALSLGLVGALSIVRFRAAIKEPEELIYLFLVIAIGLGMGANQAGITTVAFVLILTLIFINGILNGTKGKLKATQMQLSIKCEPIEVNKINKILGDNLKIVDLKRMSENKDSMYLSYVLESRDFESIALIKEKLLSLSPSMDISFVDNSNIAS